MCGKDLAARYSVFNELVLTAFAGAILNEFEVRRKVRCHRVGLWKICADQIQRDSHSCSPTLAQRTRKDGPPAKVRKDGAPVIFQHVVPKK